jgi:SAM-dependent methyltransferase
MDYRRHPGTREDFDIGAGLQFVLAILLGLRDHHHFLDVGCGSVRFGRLLIPYLLPDRYYGIEPSPEPVAAGVQAELGSDIVRLKQPTFMYSDMFDLEATGRIFDYVWAFGIFSHAAPAQIERCLEGFMDCSHNSTLFVFNYVRGENDNGRQDWAPGHVRYTARFFSDLAVKHGLRFRQLNFPQFISMKHWLVFCRSDPKDVVMTNGQRSAFYGDLRKDLFK